jgi:transcription-repair coupling factor (superfamily II helicase)
LFFDEMMTFWDYLPVDELVITTDVIETALAESWEQVCERHAQACDDPERPVLKPEELYVAPERHAEGLRAHALLRLETHEIPVEDDTLPFANLDVSAPPGMLINQRDKESTRGLRQFLDKHDGRILFGAESAGRRELLADILRQQDAAARPIESWPAFLDSQTRSGITVAPLEKGVILPAGTNASRLAILTDTGRIIAPHFSLYRVGTGAGTAASTRIRSMDQGATQGGRKNSRCSRRTPRVIFTACGPPRS